jgi:site-specific DNA-methyltransferase (adenine-specific)
MTCPRPYFETKDVRIYHGDCRAILPQLHAERVDMVLADPPYGDTSLDWDEHDNSWVALVEPLLKTSGSLWCFGSMRMFMAQSAEMTKAWRFAQDVVWEKHNGSSMHADRFKRVHEHALQFYRKRSAWADIYHAPVFTSDAVARQSRRKQRPAHLGSIDAHTYVSEDGGPRLMRSVIYVRSCHGTAVHPTQKPEGILRPLIEYSCPPGGLLLDPTMGSGSALVVARQLGRRAIGIELDEGFCRDAVERLSQQTLSLHAPVTA